MILLVVSCLLALGGGMFQVSKYRLKQPPMPILIPFTSIPSEVLIDKNTIVLHVVSTYVECFGEGEIVFGECPDAENYYLGRFAYNVPKDYFGFEPVQPLTRKEKKAVKEINQNIQTSLKSFRKKGIPHMSASASSTLFFPEEESFRLLRNFFSHSYLIFQNQVGERYFEKRWSKLRRNDNEINVFRFLDPENPDGEDWGWEKFYDWRDKEAQPPMPKRSLEGP